MKTCRRTWQHDALRAGMLSAADRASFDRHRANCHECRARMADDETLDRLVRELRHRTDDALRTRRLRQQILTATCLEAPIRSRRWAFATVLVLAIGAVVLVQQTRSSQPVRLIGAPPAFGATIDASPGAKWSTERSGTDELVRLDEGSLTLNVRHRAPGEHFLVKLPDGEIEVKGTSFRVEVAEHATREVRVREGIVALRLHGREERLLHASESWTRSDASITPPASVALPPPRAASAPMPSAPVSASPERPVKRTASAEQREDSDAAREYRAAVDVFASGRYEHAARALHEFVTAHPAAEETQDASFLEASALAHVGRTEAAGVLAERFLDRYPRSLHAQDAATLAVRAARDRGDCASARSMATRWLPISSARTATLGTCARVDSDTPSSE